MSSSNARTAILFAALTATSLAFVTPASALDFNKPQDKRVYCQVYATQALSDVHASQARGCGFSGTSWSRTFDDHFNWCLSQGDMAATVQENVARSSAVQQCNGAETASFPPVVDEAPAQADASFPPVVAEEPTASGDEHAVQATNDAPVVEAPTPVRTASAAPPVADAGEPAAGLPTADDGNMFSRQEEAREAAERLIEFGREHKDEIRHAAHKLKEKIKNKLSELKQHHHQTDAGGQQLRAKVKDALKGALQRRLASR